LFTARVRNKIDHQKDVQTERRKYTNSFDLDQETDSRLDRVRCTARMQTHKLSMCQPVQTSLIFDARHKIQILNTTHTQICSNVDAPLSTFR